MIDFAINSVLFGASAAFFATRGYKLGIKRASLALLGFVAAYASSLLWGRDVASGITGLGLHPLAAQVLAFIFVFYAVYLGVVYLPPRFIPYLRQVSKAHRYTGAVAGALWGGLLGLVLVWSMNFVLAFSAPEVAWGSPAGSPDLFRRASTSLVAKSTSIGFSVLGRDAQEINMSRMLIESPEVFSASLDSLAKAPEMRAFWLDPEAQFYMSAGDIEKLVASSSFEALTHQRGFKTLVAAASARESERGSEITEDEKRVAAEKMAVVWRRLNALKSDPRVVSIIENPEVRALVEKQRTVALLSNPKVQELVGIVLNYKGDDSPLYEDSPSVPAGDPMAPERGSREEGREGTRNMTDMENSPVEASEIYRWTDDTGKVRFTDKDNMPADKIDAAEKVVW